MSKQYDAAVVIGRFQPVHNAHMMLIDEARQIAKRVIILVGSAEIPRSYKNPWTFSDRHRMLTNSILTTLQSETDFIIRPLVDITYNDIAWAVQIQETVSECTSDLQDPSVVLVGHKKDSSSYYLDMFPQWDYEEVQTFELLDATSVRELYFKENANTNFISGVVPSPVFNQLQDFRNSAEHELITKEHQFIRDYKQQWANSPYAPIFTTTDAVVFCLGHVLMVRRGAFPGKGQLALPGGFMDANTDRSLLDCALRELKEETNIKVPVPVLKGSITDKEVFDSPDRSQRGRTITYAFEINLENEKVLPKIKGGDDAAKAVWIPLGELKSSECYEDHYQIITHFVGS